jgi:ankyrin repeat protein
MKSVSLLALAASILLSVSGCAGTSGSTGIATVECERNASLVDAAYAQNYGEMMCLLGKGANASEQDALENTPLNILALHRTNILSVPVAAQLLKNGADLDHKNREGYMPLASAAKADHYKMVDFLIAQGAELNATTTDWYMKIADEAVRAGAERSLELILAAGGPRGDDRIIVSHKGVYCKHRIERMLSDGGLAQGVLLRDRPNALFRAVYAGNYKEAVALLDKNASLVQTRNFYYETPLLLAVDRGELQIAEKIIQTGGEMNVSDIDGNIPLTLAVQNHDLKMIGLLLKHGASLERTGQLGMTPLGIAVMNGDHKLATWLLNHGASIDASDSHGLTPYLIAEYAGHVAIADDLIARGADRTRRDRQGDGVIEILFQINDASRLRKLLDAGMTVDDKALRRRLVQQGILTR